MMINALKELIEDLGLYNSNKLMSSQKEEVFNRIAWACVEYDPNSWKEESTEIMVLKPGYSKEDLDKAFKTMDFEYDSGYGSQYIHGIVFLRDGTWLARKEYDGSEWWSHEATPDPESFGFRVVK